MVDYFSLEKEDSCNGSKTQSSATTESNTPENTVRLDAIDSNATIKTKHQHNHSFSDTGEFITESKLSTCMLMHFVDKS